MSFERIIEETKIGKCSQRQPKQFLHLSTYRIFKSVQDRKTELLLDEMHECVIVCLMVFETIKIWAHTQKFAHLMAQ